MERSKTFISQALSTLKDNIERTGDPLGFKSVYWTQWADGLNLPRRGKTVLFTARMYQMLPYVIQMTSLVASARCVLSRKRFGKIVNLGNRLVGEQVIRLRARGAKEIKSKSSQILQGIVAALNSIGSMPAYLYEDEPYSGVLLHDLGLTERIAPQINKVYALLKSHGVEEVIAVDPHTAFMLREIYPQYIAGSEIQTRHYLEILAKGVKEFDACSTSKLPREFVIHDPCVMARDLGIVEQARKVGTSLGINFLEPENSGMDTACCGGPVEYAFADLSERISRIRIQELAGACRNVLVMCPICLINLSKYEQELGIKVWDLGELLFSAFSLKTHNSG